MIGIDRTPKQQAKRSCLGVRSMPRLAVDTSLPQGVMGDREVVSYGFAIVRANATATLASSWSSILPMILC